MVPTPQSICKTPAPIGLFEVLGTHHTDVANGDAEVPDAAHEDLDFGLELLADLEQAEAAVTAVSSSSNQRQDFERTLISIMENADKAHVVEPSEAIAATVPELMDQTAPLEVRMATQIERLRVPPSKSRKKKTFTPEAKKDAAYLARRAKNNKAAALNRAKERATRVATKQRANFLSARNINLRAEVKKLEEELRTLQVQLSVGNVFSDLSAVEYSLSPPVCIL